MEIPWERRAAGGPAPAITILGVPIACMDAEAALAEIERLYAGEAPALVFYANAHTLNLAHGDPAYREVLCRADLVLNDGSGLAAAARLQGRHFPANLNGTDFTPRILGVAARRGWRVYLVGARPGVARQAAERLTERIPGLQVAGTQHGYFPAGETGAVVEAIRGVGADVVLAAFGNPLQERWLHQHLPATGARLGIGVGAFLDFAAGAVPRAPAWMRRAGIEWLYRLGLEPGRMWRRYAVGNPAFLARVAKERWRSRGAA